jgi:hypothetical protein
LAAAGQPGVVQADGAVAGALARDGPLQNGRKQVAGLASSGCG